MNGAGLDPKFALGQRYFVSSDIDLDADVLLLPSEMSKRQLGEMATNLVTWALREWNTELFLLGHEFWRIRDARLGAPGPSFEEWVHTQQSALEQMERCDGRRASTEPRS
jgi:hypothetical protein